MKKVQDPAVVPAVQDLPGAASGAARRPSGLPHAVVCYVIWGFMPIYFHALGRVGPLELVAHRIVWSILLLIGIILSRRQIRDFARLLRNRHAVLTMAASAIFIAINWLVYIWAVSERHVLAGSLGYFLNPLVNVILAWAVLKERLRPAQWAAVALASVGVAIMAMAALQTLWISLVLAVSFAFYGVIRKTAPTEAMEGLALETLILSPIALGYLIWLWMMGGLAFGQHGIDTAMLVLTGVVTSMPLLLFAIAARRLSFSSLGLLQYIAPTIQFAVAVWLFGEPVNNGQLFSFVFIWTGLAIFTVDALRAARRI